MKSFSIEELKSIIDQDTGYRLAINDSYTEAKIVGGLASSAGADVTIAINCILVDYNEKAIRLAEKAYQWLKEAIEQKEQPKLRDFVYPEDVICGPEPMRYEDMTLLYWLLNNKQDTDSFEKYVEYEDHYLQNPKMYDKWNIHLTLPTYLDGGYYGRALEIFNKTPGLKPPVDPGRIKNEGGMVYVLAKHYMGQDYTEEQVKSALNGFLNRNVNGWLVNGHSARAARWMKLAYWNPNPGTITPRETILKCYNHLSHIKRPL
ncbi:MAG: hypothetical protein ABFD91_08995 [Anaerohalosphaeraceae bacterium]